MVTLERVEAPLRKLLLAGLEIAIDGKLVSTLIAAEQLDTLELPAASVLRIRNV
jgi:hypothetical protein